MFRQTEGIWRAICMISFYFTHAAPHTHSLFNAKNREIWLRFVCWCTSSLHPGHFWILSCARTSLEILRLCGGIFFLICLWGLSHKNAHLFFCHMVTVATLLLRMCMISKDFLKIVCHMMCVDFCYKLLLYSNLICLKHKGVCSGKKKRTMKISRWFCVKGSV